MQTSVTFIDTTGVQRSVTDARLVTPAGHVTGHRSLTLWLRESKHNRYCQYPYRFSETDFAEGLCHKILAHVGV